MERRWVPRIGQGLGVASLAEIPMSASMSEMACRELPPHLSDDLKARRPVFWINRAWRPATEALAELPISLSDVVAAERRLMWFAPLLAELFPEVRSCRGEIESQLVPIPSFQSLRGSSTGRWYAKADNQLPIAGSIKARGGIYEVLLHAERLARQEGLTRADVDWRVYCADEGRALFARHGIAVGSTGNLGLSIGTIAAALNFRTVVHMSADAKPWKKQKLRDRGALVVEHEGDYGEAVATGRVESRTDPTMYFVDDENSIPLFLGYAVAALRLRTQLQEAGVIVNHDHPLFVYLPCGVGGAPAGITFGLKSLFGDHAHCVLAEPTASPSMLLRLAGGAPLSVYDIGLDNVTEADGLAVASASDFAAHMLSGIVSASLTVSDDIMIRDMAALYHTEGLKIEPSAAAGLSGAQCVTQLPAGEALCRARHITSAALEQATHVFWLTGGSQMPEVDFHCFVRRGDQMTPNHCA
jgi:D-serine dehydratase